MSTIVSFRQMMTFGADGPDTLYITGVFNKLRR
jgi:hypothetical protein